MIALFTIPAVVAMRPVDDADIWWHLRAGQWIIEDGSVPLIDPFSIFGQARPWVAYSWLFELMTYSMFRSWGLSGLLLLRLAMVLAVALAVHCFVVKRERRFLVANGLVGLAFLAMIPLFSERPWLLTIVFFALTLDAVLELRSGRVSRVNLMLPLVFVIWANVHIQFIYGLFLLILGCVAPVADRILGLGDPAEDAARPRTRAWWQLVLLTLACALATLVNPYHVRIYGVVADYAMQTGAYDMIQEHLAMDFRSPGSWVVLAFALAAAFVLGRRRVSSFDVVLLIVAAYFSFHSRRDLWFMVLAALTIITRRDSTRKDNADPFVMTSFRVFMVAAGVAAVLGVTAWGRGLSAGGLERAVRDRFPEEAAVFVDQHGYGGPLYNHLDWGGYLIWRLPHLPVTIDGRTNLHEDKRIARSLQTWAGESGWDSDPDLTASRLVISRSSSPLSSLLRCDLRFELVHRDALASVFVARPIPQTR